ncbi:F-box/kelch-repeat protein SKIP25 [Lactuca sativa]|uniref:F-box domain-containing protein n=1 Tax=Lactuca sativa TaxID=4236 RepID=A0A9R1UQD5_LACSA|nr:F-box/kelch-repeat protein SKIP25 [Lactuca sativa]KAJ0190991.1 hypothetical protein LSAT_V11C800425650 [Lactuca sativa]
MSPSFDDSTISISRAATITTATAASKRRKLVDHHLPMIPGLPDHIAQLCLSRVHPSILYTVCRSWQQFIYSATFPPFHSLYTLSTTTPTDSSGQNSTLQLSSFDPISSHWSVVTPTPYLRNVCLRHSSFIARNLPIQSVSVAGNLVLLAGTSSDLLPAFSHPIIFNPLTKKWSSGPPLLSPRRWCIAGTSRAAVFVASGIGSHYTQTVARSVEKWIFRETDSFDSKRKDSNCVWKNMRSLRDGRLCREAIGAVGCKGKLYTINMKGSCGKEGLVYDVNCDSWSEMPAGMLDGWKGPAAAMDEETIYMVDESEGVLKKYDEAMKAWINVMENDMLKGAEHIAAGGGRVCIVRSGGVGILAVDVVSPLPQLWVLDSPAGQQVLALHILPRMCPKEFQSPVVV